MRETSLPNKHLLLSFSGIDGAGKSTQIARLQNACRLEGLKVDLLSFWDDVAALKNFREDVGHKLFKGDTGVGSPENPICRRDKNIRSPLLTLFRMVLYSLDTLSLRLAVKKKLRDRPCACADVIIFDRFIYDELANLNLETAITRFYIRMLLRFVPKPAAAFVLDADPKEAFARKPEYPIEFLHANRNAYLKLAEIVGMEIIEPSSSNDAHAEILQRVQQIRNPPDRGC